MRGQRWWLWLPKRSGLNYNQLVVSLSWSLVRRIRLFFDPLHSPVQKAGGFWVTTDLSRSWWGRRSLVTTVGSSPWKIAAEYGLSSAVARPWARGKLCGRSLAVFSTPSERAALWGPKWPPPAPTLGSPEMWLLGAEVENRSPVKAVGSARGWNIASPLLRLCWVCSGQWLFCSPKVEGDKEAEF